MFDFGPKTISNQQFKLDLERIVHHTRQVKEFNIVLQDHKHSDLRNLSGEDKRYSVEAEYHPEEHTTHSILLIPKRAFDDREEANRTYKEINGLMQKVYALFIRHF